MSGADPWRATAKKCPLGSHRLATCARKNSCLAFCRRPRPDMQLPGARKPHQSFDLEWRHGARSTHRISPSCDVELDCFWQKVETQTWTVGDMPAGTWVSSRNLTYVKVVSTTVLLGDAQWLTLHRFLTRHTWQGTTNCTQRMT
jgi:hypothetical protein